MKIAEKTNKVFQNIGKIGDFIVSILSNWFFVFNGAIAGTMLHNIIYGALATILFLIVDVSITMLMLGGISEIMTNHNNLEENYNKSNCKHVIVVT